MANLVCRWLDKEGEEYRLVADYDRNDKRSIWLERSEDGAVWGLDWRLGPALQLLADVVGTRSLDDRGGLGELLKEETWHGPIGYPVRIKK